MGGSSNISGDFDRPKQTQNAVEHGVHFRLRCVASGQGRFYLQLINLLFNY